MEKFLKYLFITAIILAVSGCSDNPASEEDDPMTIVTGQAEPKAFSAVLHGTVNTSKIPDRMGFEYSYDKSFPYVYTRKVWCECKVGDYSVEIKGLTDLKTIYYRARMDYEGEIVEGKTMSFQTKQGTYSIDGKTYKFIKVEGGPTGTFSMMQTELPPKAVLEIDGIEIGRLDSNENGEVTKGETREFIARSPILFRAPSASEWIFAASGGLESKGYIYSGSDDLNEVGWYSENAQGSARRPAQKRPNELGFFDMSGNYSEFAGSYSTEFMQHSVEYANYMIGDSSDPLYANVDASYFQAIWNSVDRPSRGGNWKSAEKGCTVKSTLEGIEPQNRFFNEIHTFRFAYSRPDIGEDVDPESTLNVETVQAYPESYKAMLEGRVTGSNAPDEVGFEYSYSSDFKKEETTTIGLVGTSGTFKLETKFVYDLCKVYYRAYARTDGVVTYGETKTFETSQGYYYLNGKKYKFIKVTGLNSGSFSMMQTELIPNAKLKIEGYNTAELGTIDMNGDGYVTKGETREYLSNSSGIIFRTPSVNEWRFAASAGQNFKYSGSNNIDEVAWYYGNSSQKSHPEAQKQPNALGFYDMSGNYEELCANYNDDQLLDMVIFARKMKYQPSDVSAEYFNNSWNATTAMGGFYGKSASGCEIKSSDTYNGTTSNKIDASRYTFRFVYSRPD